MLSGSVCDSTYGVAQQRSIPTTSMTILLSHRVVSPAWWKELAEESAGVSRSVSGTTRKGARRPRSPTLKGGTWMLPVHSRMTPPTLQHPPDHKEQQQRMLHNGKSHI